MALKGSKTHENLKQAFASEAQANRRYLYFARRADIEGYPEIGGLFRDTAEAETGHAFGHLDFLREVGDPATGFAIGATDANSDAKKTPIIACFFPNGLEIAGASPTPANAASSVAAAR